MKLSELLAKPIRVKGGGIVNLKGLSKHIVDKEIGGSDGESDDADVFAKYGCVHVVNSDINPDSTKAYIKMVVGDRNKRITITPDDFLKYQTEVQNLIDAHQEAGDLSSYILAEEQVTLQGANLTVTIFDLIPSSLSNIEIDTDVYGVSSGSYQYNVPGMFEFYAEKNIIMVNDTTNKVTNGFELFGNTSPIDLQGLCLIAFDNYFGIEKSNKLSMPALYIDVDATPTEDYKIPAKFVWVTIEALI